MDAKYERFLTRQIANVAASETRLREGVRRVRESLALEFRRPGGPSFGTSSAMTSHVADEAAADACEVIGRHLNRALTGEVSYRTLLTNVEEYLKTCEEVYAAECAVIATFLEKGIAPIDVHGTPMWISMRTRAQVFREFHEALRAYEEDFGAL